jgi:hypothetical protein
MQSLYGTLKFLHHLFLLVAVIFYLLEFKALVVNCINLYRLHIYDNYNVPCIGKHEVKVIALETLL